MKQTFAILNSCKQAVLVYGGLLFVASNAWANYYLSEVHALLENGASSLALHVISQQQPSLIQQPEKWMAWERERIDIYKKNAQWAMLAQRMRNLPTQSNFPKKFITWACTQRIIALLESKQASLARQELMSLFWTTDTAIRNEWIETWRRLVIQSYVADSNSSDAHIAALLFKKDYGDKVLADKLLRARIMIMDNRADEAVEILAKHAKNPKADMLYLLAQLRSNIRAPRKVQQAALRHMRGDWVNDKLKSQLWAVVAEAAERAGDNASTANALEKTLVSDLQQRVMAKLFKVNSDTLWTSYINYAKAIGNRSHFLIGEDAQWLAAAKQAQKKRPVRSRALFAFIMIEGASEQTRQQATRLFVQSLTENTQTHQLLFRMFMHSKRFAEINSVPEYVRHQLVDIALENSDLKQASKIMATISAPPQATQDSFMWHLRRARILVLGGHAVQGGQALSKLMLEQQTIKKARIDNLLQVIFDLQTMKEHEWAYQLLEKTLQISQHNSWGNQFQREIMYWMADSRKAQKRYDDAARLYLKSAMIPEPSTMDDWAQSARYQAANSLAHAGLTHDARGLYTQLLRVTKQESRRVVLKRELQKLSHQP